MIKIRNLSVNTKGILFILPTGNLQSLVTSGMDSAKAEQYQENLRCAKPVLNHAMTIGLDINELIFQYTLLMSYCSEFRTIKK